MWLRIVPNLRQHEESNTIYTYMNMDCQSTSTLSLKGDGDYEIIQTSNSTKVLEIPYKLGHSSMEGEYRSGKPLCIGQDGKVTEVLLVEVSGLQPLLPSDPTETFSPKTPAELVPPRAVQEILPHSDAGQ